MSLGRCVVNKVCELACLRTNSYFEFSNHLNAPAFVTMKLSLLYQLVAIFGICLLFSNVFGGTVEWTTYRGPGGQGVSEAQNVPSDWSIKEDVVWKTEIPGRGWSSPLLIDGKIILTSGVDEPVDGLHDLIVLQLDAVTGKIIWQKVVLHATPEEADEKHPKNSLASPTPVIEDGIIYAHFGHMGTVALDFNTGETLWKQKIYYSAKNGAGGSPIIVDDLLVYNTDGDEDPVVTALYKATGKIAWRTTRSYRVKNDFSFGTPFLINNAGRREIISQGSGMIGGYDPQNGKELWRVRYPMGYSISTKAIFVNDVLYVLTGFGRPVLYAIRVDGATGDLTDTHVLWKYHKSMPKTPSPNYVDGNIITLEDGGRLQSFDAETGEHRWIESLKGKFSASPIQIGNQLHLISEEGLYLVVEVGDDGCEILHEVDIDEEALATPAIVDNTIYIRTQPHLWKIGTR